MSEPEVLWTGSLEGWPLPLRVNDGRSTPLVRRIEVQQRHGRGEPSYEWLPSDSAAHAVAGAIARELRELREAARAYRSTVESCTRAIGPNASMTLHRAEARLAALLPATPEATS